ncbi:(2Fe-2S)-binding protein [Saccharopolyspora sp. HNM0986]|uniref:2Fe-2S iron-sulfur cluster-binding protein n=1 Tax=Saccharopolyspora galaxeae TaxID=2781241 RepID=UPI00190E191D|nr:2Fe-2S iron-sulfur cluster-binding protein [Saccharopolyspora sp. HNM0986]MBK0869209.1 (2Fe-2S)-binding protein [Saccharopolyspora sp. HNM0986]
MTRLGSGGRIDRSRTVRFTVDGVPMLGHPGDTLASALLAAGEIEAAPSPYLGRPRGILTADASEPNAMVQVLDEPEPMVPATEVELRDGLEVARLSGVGWAEAGEESRCDKKYRHADVVVIGAGPAGIAAALAAGRSGARVILVERNRELGGALLDGDEVVDGLPGPEWVRRAVRELVELPETRVLTRATAVGHYDHGYLLVAEHPGPGKHPGQHRLWHLRTQQVVLAAGARERPIAFAGNDRPGVVLASAVRRYVRRFAVLPGREVVVCTTSDSAYATALDLVAAGARVPVLVDSRNDPPARLAARAREAGIPVRIGSAVVQTVGAQRVSGVRVRDLDERGRPIGEPEEFGCDLLAVCGGWNPATELAGSSGALRWDPVVAGFVPDPEQADPDKDGRIVGAARGTYDLAGCLAQGFAAGAASATASGFRVVPPPVPAVRGDLTCARPRPLWLVDGDEREIFVDQARDATVADVRRAVEAGLSSPEHVKRYTTIGTGSDQGATSGIVALGVLATLLGMDSPAALGPTGARPPTRPVRFELMAGRDRGELHDPVRTTPMHAWHVRAGAEFENVGQWKRPWYYPQPGEDMETAVLRECAAARTGVAMMDASTLGKIEVVGPDAPEFLNRVYTNGFAKLAVGKARYGMMCTADGMVFDDGVTMRLAADRYLMSTTTGNAAAVLDWLEEWLQTEWPQLDVRCTSVTEQWATIAVAGPDSRAVLARVAPELDVSAAGFGFMEVREALLRNGIPARICRISFSGELAFEINVESWYGQAAWDAVTEDGADLGITPYGTETMHVLRAEKGFVIVGQDTDGTVTPLDLGMDWVVSKRKDCIGKRSFARPDTARSDRKQLVGLLPVDSDALLPEGAQLIEPGTPLTPPVPMLGHVTSSYRSAALGRTFALALIRGGRGRVGEVLHAPLGGTAISAEVTEPVFYDPEGARRDGHQPG